jgi:hypothetical protein
MKLSRDKGVIASFKDNLIVVHTHYIKTLSEMCDIEGEYIETQTSEYEDYMDRLSFLSNSDCSFGIKTHLLSDK